MWSRYYPPMVLWSLSNEILWPHSVESYPISGWLNRSLISWLSFCAVRFLRFFAYVLTTSVPYGMFKSLCKVTFDMCQGALASFLKLWFVSFISKSHTKLWTYYLKRSATERLSAFHVIRCLHNLLNVLVHIAIKWDFRKKKSIYQVVA
jgi:hypothetical protein